MTLKDIIYNSNDLFEINILKSNKNDKSSWFTMIDKRWKKDPIDAFNFNHVWLRRGDCFFMAYENEIFKDTYFVDPKKAMFRTSIQKYISNAIQYYVYSNDISKKKNDPSFKISERDMRKNNIDNFLDLCYYYNDYSAIGTGYTRNLRNLIVMDIDVDCTKPDNQERLKNFLYKFGRYNNLPDFIIYNTESKHVQLQWLIQNLEYKIIDNDVYNSVFTNLKFAKNKNCKIDNKKTDFTKLSENGIIYRRFTMALCKIENKQKFGDSNYTFWKAKNPMCALKGNYGLELKIPVMKDGKIKFLSKDDMDYYFSTKERRKVYFEEAPTLDEWYKRIEPIMCDIVANITDDTVKNIKDATTVMEKEKKRKKKKSEGSSRNTFVLECTRNTTWDVAREEKINPNKIKTINPDYLNMIKTKTYNIVYEKYKQKNMEYKGIWPGTTNKGSYTNQEFIRTFNDAFQFALDHFNSSISYSITDREKSLETRQKRMKNKLMIVNELISKHMTRNELLKETNNILQKNNMKQISLSTLKRYISIINKKENNICNET